MSDPGVQRRRATRILGAVFAVLLLVGFVWFVRSMMAGKIAKPDRVIQTVQVIRPPPPPPDQPPPPPPEKTEQEIPKDTPQPAPDNDQSPPPDQPLGLDAEGTAGSDSFGLAARSGGSGLLEGTGRAPFGHYTNRIRDVVQDKLAAATCTRAAKGSLSVHVLMEADGGVKQVKLASSTGDAKLDQCVEGVLSTIKRMEDPPPSGMPEQITLQINFKTSSQVAAK